MDSALTIPLQHITDCTTQGDGWKTREISYHEKEVTEKSRPISWMMGVGMGSFLSLDVSFTLGRVVWG